MDINQAKDTVIRAGKELVNRGLIARTWGNVSQRIDDHTMVITPSGRDYLSLTRDDIVLVNIDTLEYDGDIKPSSEKGVHASCYKYKNVNFVIHTHQLYASVVSACGIGGFQCDRIYPKLGTSVLCAAYGLPGTHKLNQNVIEALKQTDSGAIIMKNHGAVCFGKDFEATFEIANELEEACRVYTENAYLVKSGEKKFDETKMADFFLSKQGIKPTSLKIEPHNIAFKAEHTVLVKTVETAALSCLPHPLKPLVDDFAQIVGVKMKAVKNSGAAIESALKRADAVFVKGFGAVCFGATEDDAKAVAMIVEKNCKAFLGASLIGKPKPINSLECRLMRTVYRLKYSKQINNSAREN